MNDPPDIIARRGAAQPSAASPAGGQHFVITSPMQQVTLSQVRHVSATVSAVWLAGLYVFPVLAKQAG